MRRHPIGSVFARCASVALGGYAVACSGSATVDPFLFSGSASTSVSTTGAGGVGGTSTTNTASSSSTGTLDSIAVGAGGSGSGGSPLCGTELLGRVRDVHDTHPDFEKFIAFDPGIVKDLLGADKKPVYGEHPSTPTTTGKANFDTWYRDVPDVNMGIPLTLKLVDQGNGIYGYDDQQFFPIDNQGFGNEGRNHNFHFTFELHTQFVYKGFEVFEFSGDDDLWVFVNHRLAIDLGGVHGAMNGKVDIPAKASEFGMTVGNVYALDLFFAERHTVESHFKLQTTIGSFTDCGSNEPQ